MRLCASQGCPNPAADSVGGFVLNEDGTEPGYLSCRPCIDREAAENDVRPWGVPGRGDQVELFT